MIRLVLAGLLVLALSACTGCGFNIDWDLDLDTNVSPTGATLVYDAQVNAEMTWLSWQELVALFEPEPPPE